jgi:hypothetical protein
MGIVHEYRSRRGGPDVASVARDGLRESWVKLIAIAANKRPEVLPLTDSTHDPRFIEAKYMNR